VQKIQDAEQKVEGESSGSAQSLVALGARTIVFAIAESENRIQATAGSGPDPFTAQKVAVGDILRVGSTASNDGDYTIVTRINDTTVRVTETVTPATDASTTISKVPQV